MGTPLELRDQVLLVPAVVGLEDQLPAGPLPVVGQVEPPADLVEQSGLAFLDRDRLADDDQPVRLLAGRRAVADLGHVLAEPGQGPEAALADDLVLDPLGTPARLAPGGGRRGP